MNISSDISLWWLLPIALISTLLGMWLYSKKSAHWLAELSNYWRIFFIVLRSLSFFILGILLLGIIFQAMNYRSEKPILLIGIDDSSSMLNYKDSSDVTHQVESLIETAKNELGDQFKVLTYSFSGTPTPYDTVQFKAHTTDLAKALTETKNEFYNQNLAGIVLVSDGNFNTGNNPIYTTEKFTTTSIYTLGVGDTITKRDQLIKHISHNDVAFLKNDFPLVVDVEGNKMGRISTEIWVEQNGKKITSQTINYTDGTTDYEQVTFLLNATTPGIHKYTIHLTHKDKEYNYENNSRTVYIDVIDSRSKVLILSAAPHPDVAALKSVWEKDQNLDVQFQLLTNWDKKLNNVDLIVWHEPGLNANRAIQQTIMNNEISKLFIVGSQSNASSIYQLNLGIEIPAGKNLDDVEASYNTGFTNFEISEELKKTISSYPPLKAKFGKFDSPKNAQTLLYQRVGPVTKKEPLLFFAMGKNEAGKSYKYGFLFGEGIWRWKLTEFAKLQSSENFNELFTKVGQYLTVKQNTDPFRVTLPKKFYPTEPITINATVLNASLDPITTAEVKFVLTSETGKISNLQFGVLGEGYQLDLGKLATGKYSWKASTTINGKYHEKKGEFSVNEFYIEQADSKADHLLLNQLAKNTGGMYQPLKNYTATIKAIKSRKDFTSMSFEENTFNELIEYFILFLVLCATLFTEWFFRKYLGA